MILFFLLLITLLCNVTRQTISFVIVSKFSTPFLHDYNGRFPYYYGPSSSSSSVALNASEKKLVSSTDDDIENLVTPLMNILSSHFISQSLSIFVKMGIPDILGDKKMSVEQIVDGIRDSRASTEKHATSSSQNVTDAQKDAIYRVLRHLASHGILHEELLHQNDNIELDEEDQEFKEFLFSLSKLGALLQNDIPEQPSLSSCILHWTEKPLWNAWSELADVIQNNDEQLPFVLATGVSPDDYYSTENNKNSLLIANDFVRFIHDREISAILDFDWNQFSGKTVVDVGGHNGKVMSAVASKFHDIECLCLDLEEVVSTVKDIPPGVTLVAGDVMDHRTIPKCDVIFLKHILDRSMWSNDESIKLLQSCYAALPESGKGKLNYFTIKKNSSNYFVTCYIYFKFILHYHTKCSSNCRNGPSWGW